MKQQFGLSLVEVMVSVAILASGLLGLAALQSKSLVIAQSTQYRSIAADLAADLADRIRVNRSPFFAMTGTTTHADLPLPPDFALCPQNTSTPDTAPSCTTPVGHQSYRVATEMSEWNTTLRAQLPNGRYTLTSTAATPAGFYRYNLTITWADERNSASPDFSYSTVIE